MRERKYTPASLRQARASLGCFYLELLGRTEWKVFSLVKTKERERLPVVVSRGGVKRIFDEVRELRYLAPLTLIYLCGLRLSEALHVEIRDIHRKEGRRHVREGKGGKERMVPLPEAALEVLGQTLVYAHLTAVSEQQTQEAVARMAAALTRPPAIAPPTPRPPDP